MTFFVYPRGEFKKEFATYLQFFDNFLNEVSALCIREVTSGKGLLLAYNFLLLAYNFFHNFLNEISALCIHEVNSRKSLLLTYLLTYFLTYLLTCLLTYLQFFILIPRF